MEKEERGYRQIETVTVRCGPVAAIGITNLKLSVHLSQHEPSSLRAFRSEEVAQEWHDRILFAAVGGM